MRFHKSETAPDRRRQRRSLALTVALMLVIAAVLVYRNSQPSQPRTAEVDESLAAPLQPALFGVAQATVRREPIVVADARLDKSMLGTVHDDTLGIRRDEADAFFAVLDHADRVPAAELARAARDDLLYANLMSDPDAFRGELVSIVGVLQSSELSTTANEFGIGRLYEAWVFTGDSGARPLHVIAVNLDQRIATGETRPVPVRVTGYFFKREGYDSPSGLRIAPTLLAQTIAVDPAAAPRVATAGLSSQQFGVAVALGLILMATVLSLTWSDRRILRGPLILPPVSAAVLASIAPVDQRSVKEQLRELSERHRIGRQRGASRSTSISSAAKRTSGV